MTPAIASVLDAFHEEESYRSNRLRTDGTVVWYGRFPIASRDRLGRIYILAETAAWSEACRQAILATRKTFPDSFISVALPLPTLSPE